MSSSEGKEAPEARSLIPKHIYYMTSTMHLYETHLLMSSSEGKEAPEARSLISKHIYYMEFATMHVIFSKVLYIVLNQ